LNVEYQTAVAALHNPDMSRPDLGDRSRPAITARLIATREALNLSQRELCSLTGIDPPQYNNWEHGSRPGIDAAFTLCDTFGLTLDWIYRGDPSRLPMALAEKIIARLRHNASMNVDTAKNVKKSKPKPTSRPPGNNQ
jgi:transcriptional regulator with XRE-family HTH domain